VQNQDKVGLAQELKLMRGQQARLAAQRAEDALAEDGAPDVRVYSGD
jgi:hypothetical protein